MSRELKEIIVAVMGQPNVGKSTLFNVLTGRNVHVANWPGVTVERHEGWRIHRKYKLVFVDLPGTYGLSASTLEEVIARNYLLSKEPDVVLVLVDSTIPERTLYLALQVLEVFPKTIIVFTKSDLAHVYGVHINPQIFSHKLGVPVVMVSAAKGIGIEELLDKIIDVYHGKNVRKQPLRINYGELEPYIESIEKLVRTTSLVKDYPPRWLAIRLLEGDQDLIARLKKRGEEDIVKDIMAIREEVIKIFKRAPEEILAQKRFAYLESIVKSGVVKSRIYAKEHKFLDKLFFKPVIGPLASILLLIGIFILVFTLNTGFPLNIVFSSIGLEDIALALEEYSLGSLMEKAMEYIADFLSNMLSGQPDIVQAIVVDGIIGGVGAVLVFLPLILLVALFLAILEDSGLAPRIAVSLHPYLQRIGVSGHAIFPITLSLGCNVPAIVATRATPSFRERLRLIMTVPFIPCQARLVVILAFASAIKGLGGVVVIVLAYIGAFLVFSLINKILLEIDKRKHIAEEPELLLELPPIHKPLAKVVWWHTWDAVKHFLKKAGTIIFLVSIISWLLLNYDINLNPVEDPGESIGATIASFFAPLLYPLGLDYRQAWMTAFAFMIGFLAKEAVVGTISILTGEDNMGIALKEIIGLSDPQIASLTMFSVLYVPCLATLAVIYLETRSMKITVAVIALMMIVAYSVSLLTYGLAMLSGV